MNSNWGSTVEQVRIDCGGQLVHLGTSNSETEVYGVRTTIDFKNNVRIPAIVSFYFLEDKLVQGSLALATYEEMEANWIACQHVKKYLLDMGDKLLSSKTVIGDKYSKNNDRQYKKAFLKGEFRTESTILLGSTAVTHFALFNADGEFTHVISFAPTKKAQKIIDSIKKA
jgi:hypothetical protein